MTDTHSTDVLFMQRCLQLAALGELYTAPNPMVGAVIVHEGRVIGEGWHRQYGEPHAEVMALASVAPSNRDLISQSTLYVSLEPCSHFGKTPPCSDMIIKEKIPVVVIGSLDDNPLVGGKGIQKLRAAGIEVRVNVLAEACRQLNKKFFTGHRLQRPFITLKWAQTSDGFVAKPNGQAVAISSTFTARFTHRLRANHMGILCGAGTVLSDRPLLNNRLWKGRNPQVIILDPKGYLSNAEREDDLIGRWRFTTEKAAFRQEDFILPPTGISGMLHQLWDKGIQSILVEGGPATHQMFLEAGLWDEIIVYTSNFCLGQGIAAPTPLGHLRASFSIDTDLIQIYTPQ
jgi:diaminohydroxyphosphoribosylaminopyrimidine deaminase / 5-amino-6-(5-phosphoribosylamino)uracil reductase